MSIQFLADIATVSINNFSFEKIVVVDTTALNNNYFENYEEGPYIFILNGGEYTLGNNTKVPSNSLLLGAFNPKIIVESGGYFGSTPFSIEGIEFEISASGGDATLFENVVYCNNCHIENNNPSFPSSSYFYSSPDIVKNTTITPVPEDGSKIFKNNEKPNVLAGTNFQPSTTPIKNMATGNIEHYQIEFNPITGVLEFKL